MKKGQEFSELDLLDFKSDISNIEEALNSTSRMQINYTCMVGTILNFMHTFYRNPHILHFIGHGIND